MIRLDKYLSASGLGSREFVKKLIQSGRITVEGVLKPLPETKVDDQSLIRFDGEAVVLAGLQYFMLNKPKGVLTAKSDRKDPVVMDLMKGVRSDVSPVGRLDRDTEGLLLFTNDGALAHRLLSPKSEVKKTYYLKTDRPIPKEAAALLQKPVAFKEFTSKPAYLTILGESEGTLTVTEGKFHEVKRLMHYAGCEVTELKRVAFGPLTLGDLPPGMFRPLTKEEIRSLKGDPK